LESVCHIHLASLCDLAAVASCVHDAYADYVARIGREPAPIGADYAGLVLARKGLLFAGHPDDDERSGMSWRQASGAATRLRCLKRATLGQSR